MSNTAQDHIERFNKVIVDCETFCVMTRDSELQKAACNRLLTLREDCAALKSMAIERGEEDFANLLLGFECVAICLSSEMEMWILLKDSEPDAAWDKLVDSQGAAAAAARAHPGFSHLEVQAGRLEDIEKLVFPPQVFVSAGLIVRRQECSICGGEYGECDHLAGMPYWGTFCSIVAKDIEANHMAIVKNPADKSCRIVHFTAEGGERNRMTWKVEPSEAAKGPISPAPQPEEKGDPERVLHATAIVMRAS